MPFDEGCANRAEGFIQSLRLTQGEWAGQKFTLIPWQRDTVRDVFGTVVKNEKGDTVRQYRMVYIELPKKSGKTAFTAALAAYGLYADHEPGAEVYVAAVNKKQARICFDEAMGMVKKNGILRGLSKIVDSSKRIRVPSTSSLFEVLSADAPDKHGLKPSFLALDELHAHPNGDLYRALTFGSGAARRQQLVIIITTAGDSRDGVCWDLHTRAVNKIEALKTIKPGEAEPDPSFYGVIYGADETDDWESEETWIKANPSIGYTITLEKIRAEYAEVKGRPIDEAMFKQLRLNMWGESVEDKWIPLAVWDETKDIPVDEAALAGRTCYGGLDLSEEQDLTAWVMVFPHDDDPETVDVVARIFCPAARLTDKRNPYRELYVDWVKRGLLTTTSGNAIDYGVVKAAILKDSETFKLVDFNVDRLFQSGQLSQELAKEGLTPVPMFQGFGAYALPMKAFERRLLNGKIRHGGNPLMRWQFGNFEVARDTYGNKKPNKKKAAKKIDGIVALIMALGSADAHLAEGEPDLEFIS